MEVVKRLGEALAEFEVASKAADEYGLRVSKEAVAVLNKMPLEERVELALWLTRDEHFDIAHNLMGLKPEQQAAEIQKLAKREDVRGSIKDGDTESYIDSRRQARREGRRRR